MTSINITLGTAYMRGQLTAAKGLPCVLKADPPLASRMLGLDNALFGDLQRSFSRGWEDGKAISEDLRTFTAR